MKRKNATRNAFFTSVLSLLLCVSMLVGTTFAWFTDEAKSGLNQIIAGNLDVELLQKVGETYEKVKTDDKLFDDIELWEPGMVAYETVKIANVGTLALKYSMRINSGNENYLNNHGLSEVLKFAVIPGDITLDENNEKIEDLTRAKVLKMAENAKDKGMLTTYSFGAGKMLNAKTESDPMTLIVYWPENGEKDNLYNANNGQVTSDGKPLHIDLGLTVFASQESIEAEKDSFDQYYDDTASYPENLWLGDVAQNLNIDEENKVISIATGAELAKLAKDVNEGVNNYAGYTVKLTDDIDLGNLPWTPIGRDDSADHYLKAEVDGQGHIIYNLNVTGTSSVGLFGCTYTDGDHGTSITNVHVVNATVTGNHWVGAIVGKLNYGNLTNCSVTNAKVIATPDYDGTEYDNGDKVGAIAGFVTEGDWNITGNKASNVYLQGYRDIGGIVGIAQYGNIVDNNTVENVDIVVDQATGFYGDKECNVGGIVGRANPNEAGTIFVTIGGHNSETDVTYSYTVKSEKALASAMAKGGNITLAGDVTLNNGVTVGKDTVVVLDLNGYTIKQEKAQTDTYAMIVNKGNLTINDTVGTGKISYADITDYTADINYASNTIRNEGTLTITGGTIENVSDDEVADYGYPHALDVYQGSTTNITGGTVKSLNYDAIRMFCNSATAATVVNISGGNIINRVTFQHPTTNFAAAGELNITGGNFTSTSANVNVRLLAFGTDYTNMKASITGGTFDTGVGISNYSSITDITWTPVTGGTFGVDPNKYVVDGYKGYVNDDDTYTVGRYAAADLGDKTAVELKVEEAGSAVVSAVVPAAAVADPEKDIELVFSESDYEGNFTIQADQTSEVVDISVKNLKEDNKTPIQVILMIPAGLNPDTVKLYHYDKEIECVYNPHTGEVTFETTEFSPFTVVYDAEDKFVPETPSGDNLPKAIVEAAPQHVNVTLPWGSYGQWSPDKTVDADPKLEAAYVFTCADVEGAATSPYANWYCDFYVKLNRDLGENQIFLGGNYGVFGWVGFHNGEFTLAANNEIPLLGSVTQNPWTYADVANFVGTFTCGVGDVNDALKGATFTVMLRLTNPENSNEFYNVSTINYTFE